MNRVKNVASLAAIPVIAWLLLLPGLARAEHHEAASVAEEIKAMIMQNNQYMREKLEDPSDTTSQHGSLEFWSSGGLMQWVRADAPLSKWDSFSLTPKHIKVIELPGGEAAVAMYYSEGSMKPAGKAAVGHYMTRVTQVFVKEEGKWKERAGHWSPVAAGGGTSQSAVE